MSTRWMAVQYVGDTLRLPIANESDMDKPFGVSKLESEIRRIVVNPFSDSPQTFVPEAENAKLRSELESVGTAAYLYGRGGLQTENAKLKRAAERDADVMEAINLSLEESQAENAKLIAKLNAEHIVRQNVEIENARLREELDQWERLTAGIELPEYPITQFEPKDLERENAKLRELVLDALRPKYDHTLLMTPVEWREYDDDVLRRARELGIEVDG